MTTEQLKSLALWLTDPPNRFYRYPFVKFFFRPLFYTPLTPNQVSIIHTLVGLSAAWFVSQGTRSGLCYALILYELRALLDCFDGVLARWKGLSSVFGRHIDEISDVISTVGLLIGSGFYFYKTTPFETNVWIIVAAGLTLLMMGNIYDFYRRKIGSTLNTGHDQFIEDILIAQSQVRVDSSFFSRLGYHLDKFRCKVFTPALYQKLNDGKISQNLENKKMIRYAQKHPQKTRFVLQVASLSSGDIGLFILHLGLLTGYLFEFYFAVVVLGWFFTILSLILVIQFYKDVSKEND